jgi:hypothetical protein
MIQCHYAKIFELARSGWELERAFRIIDKDGGS